jgi:UDP-N-acetylmuramate--alanine ligase
MTVDWDRPLPDPLGPTRFHYAGLGGSGMSALAQFHLWAGGRVSGSDRSFDRGEQTELRAYFERLGIAIYPQDGSGVNGCGALLVSTAVEAQVPDRVAARAQWVPVFHRAQLLAHFVAQQRGIAVAGTSGKSTVAALIFELLRGAGRQPSLINGAALVALQRAGGCGNAYRGGSDLLVVETDESDGSLVHYRPAVGVLLNLDKDHKEVHELQEMFATFCAHTREALVVGESDRLAALARDACVFGFGPRAAVRGRHLELGPQGSRFEVDRVRFDLPLPGLHNVENALAAIAVCRVLGFELPDLVRPLADFQGVARRFQSLGSAGGVEVVDDFAHNPTKLQAAIRTAKLRSCRVLAVYQPHAFAPTRFLRAELVAGLAAALGGEDRLWLLEIYYAGGSAQRDFSAAEIAREIAARGGSAEFAPSRPWLLERIAGLARAGDLVLVMGARDPSLSTLAGDILRALAARADELERR